jgi:hypothetical protein
VLPPYFWRCIFRIKVTSKLLWYVFTA